MASRENNPGQTALDALDRLKKDVLTRIGSPGGNLNAKMRANFDVIETTLETFTLVASHNATVQQNQQLIAKIYNDLKVANDRVLTLTAGNGHDEPSETKGE